jgi:O-antigen/teichoic acid export membrane protein
MALVFGLPMIIFEFSTLILDSGDRILIQHYLGSVSLGYYSAAYNVATYCQELVQAPLNLALVPMYVKLWTTKGREETQAFLSRALDDFLMIAIGVICAAVVCSRDALILLASARYERAAGLVPVLISGLMLYTLVIFFYPGLYLEKRTRTMAALVASASILNIILNIVLLPRMGLIGAVYATLASYAFLVAITVKASLRILPLHIRLGALMRYVAAGIAAMALASPLQFGRPIAGVAIRGFVSVAAYGFFLWCLDQRFRRLISRAVSYFYASREQVPTQLESEIQAAGVDGGRKLL